MKKLKELRKKYGLNQEEFGRLFYVSKNAVSFYERGKRNMSVDLAKKIGSYFNFNWWELYED